MLTKQEMAEEMSNQPAMGVAFLSSHKHLLQKSISGLLGKARFLMNHFLTFKW